VCVIATKPSQKLKFVKRTLSNRKYSKIKWT